MSAGHEQNHPYHLVDPSPWPVFGAFSGGILAIGMVFFMHDVTAWLLPLGVVLVIATMFFWWRQVVREATFEGHHTKVVQLGLRYGMVLFIASEVMFFAAFSPAKPSRSTASNTPAGSGRRSGWRSSRPSICPSSTP